MTLEKPAQRIISLAPHITENLFAAGIGNLLVGVVNYSDYPPKAAQIKQVGGYNNFNIELILSLQPDLVIAWKEGNQRAQVEQLISLGMTVYINEPKTLEDIGRDIAKFGVLSGHEEHADVVSRAFLAELDTLYKQYSGREKISVFYQVWDSPLLTINEQQVIGQIIDLCSGQNVFAELGSLTPEISVEAVLAADPQAIIASGMGEARPGWLDSWKRWSFLSAVKNDNLFFIPPDIIQRYTPRILQGTQRLCQQIQTARDKL